MKSKSVISRMMITCILFFQSATSFALMLDQAQDSPVTIGDGINQARWTWQEFRPAMDNLEQVDLLLENQNVPAGIDVFFELRQDSSVLWSTSFPANSISQSREWFVLDTPHIALVPDEAYRLCLSSPLTYEQISSGINVIWWGAMGDVYPLGTSSESFLDFGFRTWAVPEPSTITMFILGGSILLCRKRA